MFLLITVDLETSYRAEITSGAGGELVDLMVFGVCGGQRYGFQRIMEVCENGGVSATFFVSSLDSCRFGEAPFRTVCEEIVSRGHDVQVHTHPVRLFDNGVEHMWEYRLADQAAILETASGKIERWLGRRPLAHRAGAYGINEDTFAALRKNGIAIDSSSFHGHPNCKAVVTKNKVVEHRGIVEIPITVFTQVRALRWGKWTLERRHRIVKTDIDWASLNELKQFVLAAKKQNIRLMNLFMHSYSLVRLGEGFRDSEPHWENMEKLQAFLDFAAADPEVKIITVTEFDEIYRRDPGLLVGSDCVPEIEEVEGVGAMSRRAFSRLRERTCRATSK